MTKSARQNKPALVLASTSPFRRALLKRLGLEFAVSSPDIDESALPDESPEQLVVRLAQGKAEAVRDQFPHSLIIGSDQVACIEGEILGKPGNRDRAIQQLESASGKLAQFHTGLCLLNSDTGEAQVVCEPFNVHFRQLTRAQIEAYVDREQPFNCAGSFKSEGLGIALFERMQGDDPNALIGLPLIRLITMLNNENLAVL